MADERRLRSLAVCVVLAVAIVGLYVQARDHEFVQFDDQVYVTGNSAVSQGLSAENVRWAFVDRSALLWHPLTWLSLMTNAELHGVEAAGPFVLTNIALHVATSLLLLAALVSLTGRFWPSALAAAIFALHPVQVEAVAWVSGRKEVLAGFFFALTLWAYAAYGRRGGWRRYALVLSGFCLCLASKGSHASLPFVLLLLDWWPLDRLRGGPVTSAAPRSRPTSRLLLEKLPLLAISLAVVGIGMVFAEKLENPWGTDPAFAERLQGGVVNYVLTLGRLFWPVDLAITYPTPRQMGLPFWSAWQVGGAALLLAAITAGAALAGRRRGYLLVGWLWFAGMLLPMIGLVPAGLRVMHDRYTYVPMIGIAVALCFGGAAVVRRLRVPPIATAAAAAPLLIACAALTWFQVGVWKDSLSLFDHALSINERNAIIHAGRGSVFLQQRDLVRARAAYEAALAIHPDSPDVNNNLGLMLMQQRRVHEAIPYLRRAVASRPDSARELVNLGNALIARGSGEEGLAVLHRAVAAAPESTTTHYWVGAALQQLGRPEEAAVEYREALRIDPENPWARNNLDAIEARSRSRR